MEPARVAGPSARTDAVAALRDEVTRAAVDLEVADALEVCEWALGRFRDEILVASSFQDCVLIDLVVRADPQTPVVFIDTGFHFPETMAFVREITDRYRLNLSILDAGLAADVEPCGSEHCCEVRKVGPLNQALVGKSAWMTGLKRVDTPERIEAPVVGWDETRGVAKINPLAAWTEEDIDVYLSAHALPRHPLNALGYVSIGCAPTTRPTVPGEDPRAGRWPGSEKTECGLHL